MHNVAARTPPPPHTHTYLHIHTHTPTHTHPHTHTHTYLHIHTHMYAHIQLLVVDGSWPSLPEMEVGLAYLMLCKDTDRFDVGLAAMIDETCNVTISACIYTPHVVAALSGFTTKKPAEMQEQTHAIRLKLGIDREDGSDCPHAGRAMP